MTARDFRRIALGMDGAIESAHMGHPDFRAFGRIFATLHRGDKTGMVSLTPAQQMIFVQAHPTAFLPESGAWGRSGSTRVVLAAADEETVAEAMILAWQNAGAAASRKRTSKKPTATTSLGKRRSRR